MRPEFRVRSRAFDFFYVCLTEVDSSLFNQNGLILWRCETGWVIFLFHYGVRPYNRSMVFWQLWRSKWVGEGKRVTPLKVRVFYSFFYLVALEKFTRLGKFDVCLGFLCANLDKLDYFHDFRVLLGYLWIWAILKLVLRISAEKQ